MRFTGLVSRMGSLLAGALTCACLAFLPGCDTSAGTAAVVAGSIAGGIFVGSQIATHSEVEVKVEVYADGDRDPAFYNGRGTALSLYGPGDTDPVLDPSLGAHQRAAEQVQPWMEKLRGTLAKLRESRGHLQSALDAFKKMPAIDPKAGAAPAKTPSEKAGPVPVDPNSKAKPAPLPGAGVVAPAAPTPPDPIAALTEAVATFDDHIKVADSSLQAWDAYKNAVANALANSSKSPSLGDLGALLQALRSELKKQVSAPVSTGYVVFLGFHLDATAPPSAREAVATALDGAQQKDSALQPGAARMARFITAYLYAVLHKPCPPNLADELARLSSELERLGIVISADALARAYMLPNQDATEAAISSYLSGGDARDPSLLTAQDEQQRATAYLRSFVTILNDVNLGTIRQEVVQALLTSKAIPKITAPENQRNWQPFSSAWSKGHAGNHDVIIYLECLGIPILKSSAFDPSKFLVANGQVYRKAFTAIAGVLGVPQLNAVKPASTSGGTSGAASNNLLQAASDREAAQKQAAATEKQMTDALSALIDADKKDFAVAGAASLSAADLRKKAMDDLQAAIDKLAKPGDPAPSSPPSPASPSTPTTPPAPGPSGPTAPTAPTSSTGAHAGSGPGTPAHTGH